MVKGIESILIGSEDADKLAKFYKETLKLKLIEDFDMEGGKGALFDLGGTTLAIIDHSEVKGKNKGPERIILNFKVDDIEKEAERLKKARVEIKQEIYPIEGYGLIATFIDPDGNFFQLVQMKAAAN